MKHIKEAFNAIEKHNREVSGLKFLYCFSRDSWLRQTQPMTTDHVRMYTNAKAFSWLVCGSRLNKTVALGHRRDKKNGYYVADAQLNVVDTATVTMVQSRGYKYCTFYVYGTDVNALEFRIYTLYLDRDGWSITSHAIPLMVGEPAEGTLEYSGHWY